MGEDDLKYEEALLLGGPHNGQFLDVIVGAEQVLVRGDQSVAAHEQNAWVYKRHELRSNTGRSYAIYTYGKIDILKTLLEGYKKL
uniref:Uncharacterized protein n=1 Tax=Pseudomonas phage HRDY3 TaxID=3236930 RepID=A0AB39CE95_9VIRU